MIANWRKIWLYVVVAVFSGSVVAGCGDSAVNTNVDRSRSGNNGSAPKLSDDFFLVPAGETHRVGNVTELLNLKVFLYEKSTGDPAAAKNIAFEITEPPADSEASLTAVNATTADDGSADVDVRLGAQPSTLTVRAEHGSSNAVDFTIDVKPLETGDLQVAMKNTAASIMSITDVDLRLYRNGDYGCAEFRPLMQREPGDVSKYVAGTAAETVPFNDLGTGQRFLVTAVGRGPAGQIAASGCIEDISIRADQVTHKQLLLQLIPLDPVGRYDVTSHWDFSGALQDSGAVGSTIVRVLEVFEHPGQAIYDEMINLIKTFVSGLAGGGLQVFMNVTGLDGVLKGAINTVISNNNALRKVRDAGRDVGDVVANLEVHSELTIGKISSDYEFRGTDNWLGITLYWRWNCGPNAPADCGAIDLVADSDGAIGNLGVLSSEWNGRVAAYNELQIDAHPLSLRYGRLVKYVLDEVILPRITNGAAHSLSGAFTYWICDGLVNKIANSNGGKVCAPDPFDNKCFNAQNFCQTATSTVFGFADLLIDKLEYDVGLRIGGQAKLVETTSDGFVDSIIDGVYDGTMQNADLGQQQASAVSATFEAERLDFDTDNL